MSTEGEGKELTFTSQCNAAVQKLLDDKKMKSEKENQKFQLEAEEQARVYNIVDRMINNCVGTHR